MLSENIAARGTDLWLTEGSSQSTKKARELAEQSLQAEEKRLAVGMSDTYRVLQSQRDLARQRVNELNAIIAYNRSLVNFESIQIVPLGGGF